MNRRAIRASMIGLLLAWAAPALLSARADRVSAAPGVVVERTTPNFEAERAGIQPGDILLSWERGANPPANPTAASGSFRSPFDVTHTFIDQAPRARNTLTLLILRNERRLSIPIGQYPWRLETRPRFSERWLASYENGRRLVDDGQLEKGLDAWRALAAELSGAKAHVESAWLWRRIGMKLSEAKQVDAAIAALGQARNEARQSGGPEIEFQLSLTEAEVYRSANRGEDARKAGQRAVALCERSDPESLAVAYSLHELVPSMSPEAPEYEAAVRRALRIRARQAPASRAEAGSLQALLNIVNAQGDSGTSVELGLRALAIHERLNPISSDVARALTNLCVVQMNRGELAAAEGYCQRSLEQWRALGPGELPGLAQILHNIGVLARLRGELDRADALFFQSIEIAEKATPNNPYNSSNYFDLAATEVERDLDKAEQYLDRSDQIRGNPQTIENVGSALRALVRATIAYRRQDLPGAERLLRRSLAYFDQAAPNHPVTPYVRDDLGRVLTESGQTKEAEELIRRALAQRQQYAPRSQDSAQSHYNLGMLLWKTGRLAEAEASLKQAIDDYEAQTRKLGGSDESMSMFAGRFADFYKDYVRLLLEMRREQDAFLILERYRAGSFLKTLAQRDIASDDVPPDLDRERRQTNAEYDRTQADIQRLQSTGQASELAAALARLGELRRRQEDIAQRIAKASPRFGALRYPKALALADARATLDPGTLLLSYAVGKDQSWVFVVGATRDLAVVPVAIGEKDLRDSVKAFRKLIAWNTSSPELERRARALYDLLVAPVEPRVAASDRLLIVADGPLHTLPWATLMRDSKPGSPRYLAEWKPIHTAASATAFAELKRLRSGAHRDGPIDVAAFGDPKYPAPGSRAGSAMRGTGAESEPGDAYGEPQLDAILRSGFRLEPLPLSRGEVETIASLYAPRSTAYLGGDATESRARSVGRDVSLIHYACHAIVDERFPLDSALVFTIPEKPQADDNGLLQAWEILEKMRIDADLVTLSACESGLGREAGGEGLVGLTRAFQFAGAHSVLASLWKVDDRSTAALMKGFYRHLKAGKSKDEALRLAQVELIHSADFAQPRFWAAFQINGDWR